MVVTSSRTRNERMNETETERNRRIAEYWRNAYAYDNDNSNSNRNNHKDLPYEPTAVLGVGKPLTKLRLSRNGYLTLD